MTYTFLVVISLLVIVFIFFLIRRYRSILEAKQQKFASETEQYKSALEAEQLKVALEVRRREDLERKLSEAQDFISFLHGLSMSKSDAPRREYDKIINYARNNLISEIYSLMSSFDPNDFLDKFNLVESFFEKWVEKISKPWIGDNLVIAFVGKYSSGKSSIVNTILGKDLLPIDVTPTTAVPTYIYYEPKGIACKIEESDGEIKSISEDLLKKISHERFKSMPLSLIIKNLVIGYPNDILKNVSILDTPGYDSVNYKDRKRTREAITESDVVFWVVDVNDGTIKSDALKFIKDEIYVPDKPFYIVISKIDLKPPKEVEAVKSKISEQLESNGIKFEDIYLFTAKDKHYQSSLLSRIEQIASNNDKISIYDFLKEKIEHLFKVLAENEIELKKRKKEAEESSNNLKQKVLEIAKSIDKERGELYIKIGNISSSLSEEDLFTSIINLGLNIMGRHSITKDALEELIDNVINLVKIVEKSREAIDSLLKHFDEISLKEHEIRAIEKTLSEFESYRRRLQNVNANLQEFRDKLIKEGLL